MAGQSSPKPDLSMGVKDWLSHSWGRVRFAAGTPPSRYLLEHQMQYPEIHGLRVRQYQEADFEACMAMHDLNSPQRFPACARTELAIHLRKAAERYLVVQHGGRVVASGGYALQHPDRAHFFHGLVHPHYQGVGLGRVLVFSRIAQFPEIEGITAVTICAVKKSLPYYEKFGFTATEQLWKDNEGQGHPTAVMGLNAGLIKNARSYLKRARIPFPDLRSLPPDSPLLFEDALAAHIATAEAARAEAGQKSGAAYDH